MILFIFLSFALTFALEEPEIYDSLSCTAIVVGRQATTDSSTLTTHTNDCKNCDFRLARVPAADHAPGSLRPVAPVRFDYPRFVGDGRGPVFWEEKVDKTVFPWRPTEAIGFIPQVNHTYSYIDGVYAIQNEKGLSFGESTCGARLVNIPVHDGGGALFDLTELTRIACERCETARCAIQTMGDLATKYGFYGTVWKGGLIANFEAGEALTIADGKETWVWNVSPDDTGKSAVWVAQRVPENHISAVANMFTIRTFNVTDTLNYLASDNVFEVAKRANLWNPDNGPLDFVLTYGYPISPGADLYFYRRIWRVFDIAAPSLQLDPNLKYTPNGGGYPFSVRVEKLLSVKDIMAMNRDHFEGTQFDLTQGVGGGPYGNPNRYDFGPRSDVRREDMRLGYFERPISLFRTSYSTVAQSRKNLPALLGARTWFAPAQPGTSVYTPFYAATIHENIPDEYSTGHLYKFTRDAIFWISDFVANWAERMYLPMLPDILEAQQSVEDGALQESVIVEQEAVRYIANGYPEEASRLVGEWSTRQAKKAFNRWLELADYLVTKFHDGFRLTDFHSDEINPSLVSLWYPHFWLTAAGYWPNGDPHPGEDAGRVHVNASNAAALPLYFPSAGGSFMFPLLIGLLFGAFLGYWVKSKKDSHDQGYELIDESERF